MCREKVFGATWMEQVLFTFPDHNTAARQLRDFTQHHVLAQSSAHAPPLPFTSGSAEANSRSRLFQVAGVPSTGFLSINRFAWKPDLVASGSAVVPEFETIGSQTADQIRLGAAGSVTSQAHTQQSYPLSTYTCYCKERKRFTNGRVNNIQFIEAFCDYLSLLILDTHTPWWRTGNNHRGQVISFVDALVK